MSVETIIPILEEEKTPDLAAEFGWSCLDQFQVASLQTLVGNKVLLGHKSLTDTVTAEKLVPDALNRTPKGKKALNTTQTIIDSGLEIIRQSSPDTEFTPRDPRNQAEKMIRYLRIRAKTNPQLLQGIGQVLDTVAEGDLGVLFFPQAESAETQMAVWDTWGVVNDVASLLKNCTANNGDNVNDTIDKPGISFHTNTKFDIPIPVRAATTIILTTCMVSGGCTSTSTAVPKIIEGIEEKVQQGLDEMCNPDIIGGSPNLCRQSGGLENLGNLPDPQQAAENAAGGTSMGDPLYSGLPEAMRSAISLYQQTKGVTGLFAENPNGEQIEVGTNFTEVGFEEQREIVSNLVHNASEQGLRTELEIGPRNTFNPCPENSLCIKIGLENPNTSGYTTKDETTSFTGIFKMDVGKLLSENPDLTGSFNTVYTVSPFPVTEEGNIASIQEISKNAFNMTKEGGEYIIWFNPYFNQEFFDQRQAQEKGWPTTQDMYIEVIVALWGQYKSVDFGPISIMRERYPNLELPQSEFINEDNADLVNVMVVKK